MPPSNSMLAYENVRQLLDQALAAPKGIRVNVGAKGSATNLRQRCNKFRLLDRDNSRNLYPQDDPRYNTSIYDALVLSIEDTTLIIQRGSIDDLQIEEIV